MPSGSENNIPLTLACWKGEQQGQLSGCNTGVVSLCVSVCGSGCGSAYMCNCMGVKVYVCVSACTYIVSLSPMHVRMCSHVCLHTNLSPCMCELHTYIPTGYTGPVVHLILRGTLCVCYTVGTVGVWEVGLWLQAAILAQMRSFLLHT